MKHHRGACFNPSSVVEQAFCKKNIHFSIENLSLLISLGMIGCCNYVSHHILVEQGDHGSIVEVGSTIIDDGF